MKTYKAIVRAVHDGDSIKIELLDKTVKWVRLYGIDAPEIISNYVTDSQPFGVKSGDGLRHMLKGGEVDIVELGVDIYDRPLVQCFLNGQDIAHLLLSTGHAWYVPLSKGEKNLLPPKIRTKYLELFKRAKKTKLRYLV